MSLEKDGVYFCRVSSRASVTSLTNPQLHVIHHFLVSFFYNLGNEFHIQHKRLHIFKISTNANMFLLGLPLLVKVIFIKVTKDFYVFIIIITNLFDSVQGLHAKLETGITFRLLRDMLWNSESSRRPPPPTSAPSQRLVNRAEKHFLHDWVTGFFISKSSLYL